MGSDTEYVAYICDGCGHLTNDMVADLQSIRDLGGLSCCPERKMMPLVHSVTGEREPVAWQPIKTAPRDGKLVDLWCRGSGLTTGSYGRTPDCWFSAGKWWRNDELHGDDMCRSEVANATHWMPRPSPPSIRASQEKGEA